MSSMDYFCDHNELYWDYEKTWNTKNETTPDFTRCFENTALVWSPSLVLLFFAPVDIYHSHVSASRPIPRSSLSVLKYGFSLLLIIIQVLLILFQLINVGYVLDEIPVGEYLAPVVRLVTYILYCGLLYYSRHKGISSSGVQFIFWVLHGVGEAVRFRSNILRWQENKENLETDIFILEIISFPCILGVLGLNCWADVNPTRFIRGPKLSERPCPEEDSSFLARLTFEWFSPLAWKGYRKPLGYSDLWDLNVEDTSSVIVPKFDKEWDKQQLKVKSGKASYAKVNQAVGVDFTDKVERGTEKENAVLGSVLGALLGTFGMSFLVLSAMKLIPDMLLFVSPQILNLLIAYTSSGEETWKGIFYAAVLFLSAFISTMITNQYTYRMFLIAMRVRTALVSAIYKKALLVSNSAKRESTVGEIVNLMSVDIQKLMTLLPFINMVWSAPFQIGLALYFLWGIIGPSAISGLVIMILLVPANAVIASKSRKLHAMQMTMKDQRVKLMNEILNGIKVLKLYAWEQSFEEQIMKIRRQEVEIFTKTAYLNAIATFLWMCAPFMVALCTFGTYVLIDSRNVLDAQKAFVSLSLFNIISFPLAYLPTLVVQMVQASVSLKRLNKYMNANEIDPDSVTHDQSAVDPIIIENGTFGWDADTITLRDINLHVKDGSLVAIVGTVGAGKSSLLAAILGELEGLNGTVNTKGSIAYVSQQAWIQNATVRDNILFGKPFDARTYDKAIDACALKPDLEILAAGDKTEIGEKGINLSGGQKQRVSLARAVYSKSDIYLLDDPLSAVDSHVGKHIFDAVLGPKGVLKRKTRILVTHGIAYLPQVDNIVVLKDGELSEIGTYTELLERQGAFAEFLQHHTTEEDASEMDDTTLADDLKNFAAESRRISTDSESSAGVSDVGEGVRKRMTSSGSSQHDSRPQDGRDRLVEVEKSETDSVTMAVYKEYLRAAGWYGAVGTIVLYSVYQTFSVGSNLWLSEWSNQPVVNGTQDDVGLYLGVYGGFGFMQAVFIMLASVTMDLSTLRSSANLHFKMLVRILHAPMSFFDTTPVGRIVNRFAKDVDVTDSLLPMNVELWLNSSFSVLATLIIISYSTPIFIAVILPVGLLYYFVQRFFVASSRQLKRIESVTRSPIYSHFSETISGAPTIRAYAAQDRFIVESEEKVDYNQVPYFPSVVANRWIAVRLEFIGNMIIFFAALFAVLGRDTLSSGLVGLSVSYALQITSSLYGLVRWTSEVETNIVAVERIKEYGEVPQEAAFEIRDHKPPKLWPESGQVKFDQYQTRYRPGLDLVLRNVTCTINPGEKIGIVGRTGAGKSSFTLALLRIIEAASGTISIDGQNIGRLGLQDLRGRITIIPQDPVLFSGTLRINLDPFEQYTDDTIWKSLELADLKSLVTSFPTGLSHEIAEGGENLSMGQRQLIALARALLRKTKILLLDESTSACDLDTDELIQSTIRKEFKDSTVITIAHRLNTIMDSTRVMVLDKGEIREFDSPENLLSNKNSIFSGMVKDAGL
ncbi:multidrug resistance-associated protein 1 isoform X2 [Folsomia candida]|nr:multidrug resistance-associated protein 1 isoform X2 [Folsomia candida]XP_035713896.1 multidrug resistance-associated protein 1 isoform X2 [Folsomia candida]XP_035713897.1 multidrug resistance-associated protein 1 isoform X2 [Folsomia candida]XP_035713898.1 multidrug resistance-associated protein 1 isoform X2 [Folsomia candida]